MDERIEFVKDNLFLPDYFSDNQTLYDLHERKESGKSVLKVTLNSLDNLCIEDFDNSKKCGFFKQDREFGMQKSVDHVIFQNCSGNCTLHLIEMKKTVGSETFKGVKRKVRSSYLNALAIAVALGITITQTIAYTSFLELKFDTEADTNSNPQIYKPMLGERAIDVKKDEWDKDLMHINLGKTITIRHCPIQMFDSGEEMTGDLDLTST